VEIVDKLKRMSPGWFGAAAGVAVAGAALFQGSRLLAGLLGGGAVLALGIYVTPCCDGCAQGQGCGGSATTSSTSSGAGSPVAQDTAAAIASASLGGCTGCGQAASSPAATTALTAPTMAPSSTALATAHAAKADLFDGGAFLARFAR
jgi:hypothetical protein